METIKINYKDIAFLLGCNAYQAKNIIYECLSVEDRLSLGTADFIDKIRTYHAVDYDKIKITINSPSPDLDKQKQVKLTVDKMRQNGLSDNMKRNLLEDVEIIVRGEICGKWTPLKNILTAIQIKEIERVIKDRRAIYLSSGGAIPKKLTKYVLKPESV